MTLACRRPEPDEFASDYQRTSVAQMAGDDLHAILNHQMFWMCELASSLSTDQVDTVHDPYQWTIRQVFEHCANAERVFGYRVLRAAAGDSTPLTSWDENAYADARFGLGNFTHLVTELGALRKSNVTLVQRIAPACWDRCAIVDGEKISVRAIAWLAAAHLHHHFVIVEARCGVTVSREPAQLESEN